MKQKTKDIIFASIISVFFTLGVCAGLYIYFYQPEGIPVIEGLLLSGAVAFGPAIVKGLIACCKKKKKHDHDLDSELDSDDEKDEETGEGNEVENDPELGAGIGAVVVTDSHSLSEKSPLLPESPTTLRRKLIFHEEQARKNMRFLVRKMEHARGLLSRRTQLKTATQNFFTAVTNALEYPTDNLFHRLKSALENAFSIFEDRADLLKQIDQDLSSLIKDYEQAIKSIKKTAFFEDTYRANIGNLYHPERCLNEIEEAVRDIDKSFQAHHKSMLESPLSLEEAMISFNTLDQYIANFQKQLHNYEKNLWCFISCILLNSQSGKPKRRAIIQRELHKFTQQAEESLRDKKPADVGDPYSSSFAFSSPFRSPDVRSTTRFPRVIREPETPKERGRSYSQ